jgi:hypothetical protein
MTFTDYLAPVFVYYMYKNIVMKRLTRKKEECVEAYHSI